MLTAVSVSQICWGCGESPCISGGDVVCSPDGATKNAAGCGLYSVKTTTHPDGHTSTTTWSVVDGTCTSSTVCSVTVVTTFTGTAANYFNGGGTFGTPHYVNGSYTTIATLTYNADCSTTTTCSGSGTLTRSLGPDGEDPTGSLTMQPDCSWVGVGQTPSEFEITSSTETASPEPTTATTHVFSGLITDCTLLPDVDYPAFLTDASCEDQGTGAYPALEAGQGAHDILHIPAARFFRELFLPHKQARKVKFRVEHEPSPTGYLKVWLQKRTTPYTHTQSEGSCSCSWVAGTPVYAPAGTYVWDGTPTDGGFRLADKTKAPDACENFVKQPFPLEVSLEEPSAGSGLEVEVIIQKYSFVPDYTPDDPDNTLLWTTGTDETRCKKDGFAPDEVCP